MQVGEHFFFHGLVDVRAGLVFEVGTGAGADLLVVGEPERRPGERQLGHPLVFLHRKFMPESPSCGIFETLVVCV